MFVYIYINAVNVIFNYIIKKNYIQSNHGIMILWVKLNKDCFYKKIGWNYYNLILFNFDLKW